MLNRYGKYPILKMSKISDIFELDEVKRHKNFDTKYGATTTTTTITVVSERPGTMH